jgi:predicted amidophosphoribosyltransferase
LSASERQANVHNAFRCPDDRLRGQRVLLVDDVCTTGSTLEAASTALRHGGATSVWAYTLARARA